MDFALPYGVDHIKIVEKIMNEVLEARSFLEKATGPVSFCELTENSGICREDISGLHRNGVVNLWYKTIGKTIPDSFETRFSSGIAADAKKIMEYLLKMPEKLIRIDEIAQVLQIEKATVLYVLCTIERAFEGLIAPFFSLQPRACCDKCFYREKCNKDTPAERCDLFQDDYRLDGLKEGQAL